MVTKNVSSLSGRIYKEDRGSYDASIYIEDGVWRARLTLQCGDMQIKCPLELAELDELIVELQRTRAKLAEDIQARPAKRSE